MIEYRKRQLLFEICGVIIMLGFWLFMLVMVLLIPLTMVYFGNRFLHSAPSKINSTFGYRTTMSMKNSDTWKYAHSCLGKIWRICGLSLLPLSVVPLIFVFRRDVELIGTVGGIIVGLQLIPMLCSIIPVEQGLKKSFYKNGNRI